MVASLLGLTPAWLTNGMLWGTFLLQILPSRGSQEVCYLGTAPSCSKIYPRVAHKKYALVWHLPPLDYTRYATLEWHLPALNLTPRGSQNVCFGMAPSSSKFCSCVAHERYATLEWHLPPRKKCATLEWHLPLLNYALRVAHKSYATFGMKGMLWNEKLHEHNRKTHQKNKTKKTPPEGNRTAAPGSAVFRSFH